MSQISSNLACASLGRQHGFVFPRGHPFTCSTIREFKTSPPPRILSWVESRKGDSLVVPNLAAETDHFPRFHVNGSTSCILPISKRSGKLLASWALSPSFSQHQSLSSRNSKPSRVAFPGAPVNITADLVLSVLRSGQLLQGLADDA